MMGADRNITAGVLPLGDWEPVIPIPAFSLALPRVDAARLLLIVGGNSPVFGSETLEVALGLAVLFSFMSLFATAFRETLEA